MAFRLILRVEELIQHLVARGLLRLGRAVQVRPFSGFGTDGWVRFGGRVVVGAGPSRSKVAQRTSTWNAVRANLSQFITFEVPYAQAEVEISGRRVVVAADREGYVDVELGDVALAPGRHPITLTPTEPAGESAQGVVYVCDPSADIAVVSDIDDTIIDSGIARGVISTLTTALLRDAATRVPLRGAPELYRALARSHGGAPDRPFFYLSTSPWNLAGFLSRFLDQHRFPPGPLLLTDWGPGTAGLLRISTRAHKVTALRRLAERLTQVRFVLIGDTSQEDLDIYTAFAMEHPGRVAAIYVRQSGTPTAAKQQRIDHCVQALRQAAVPFVVTRDSAVMLRHAQQHGLIDRRQADPTAPGGV